MNAVSHSAPNNALLKLRAEDAEDVAVFAPLLQDAILRNADMALLPDEGVGSGQEFAVLLSRFCWERECKLQSITSPAPYKRVQTSLLIRHVIAVQYANFDRTDPVALHTVLTITSEQAAEGQKISLVFAGGGIIRITVQKISCWLQDLEDPWPTSFRPQHP